MLLRGKLTRVIGDLRMSMGLSFSSQASGSKPGNVDYTQICKIVEGKATVNPKEAPVLIDVRPATEIKSSGGTIPTAKNIPRIILAAVLLIV